MSRAGCFGITTVLVLTACGPCAAQDYPARPIRWVVPNPAGGTPDSNARLVAGQVSRQVGQNLIIDNRAGASGIIGMQLVARAEPDGYTMLFTSVNIVTNPMAFKKLPYDAVKDFVPVTNIASGAGMVVVVHPGMPVKSLQELVGYAKQSDKKITYGTPGVASGQHIGTQLFEAVAGINLYHVPYKGLPPALTALVAGEIQMMIMSPITALPHIRNGRLRVLAYTGGARWGELPDVPTVMEAGVPRYRFDSFWQALFAPGGTPARIVSKMQSEVSKALQVPAVKATLKAAGYEPVGDSPAEFRKFFSEELVRWREIARLIKMEPQ